MFGGAIAKGKPRLMTIGEALLLGLVRDGELPLARVVEALSQAPAKIAGLDVPRLAEGARADFTLVDPEHAWTIAPERLRSKSHNTPFMGQTVRGLVTATVVHGDVVFEGAR